MTHEQMKREGYPVSCLLDKLVKEDRVSRLIDRWAEEYRLAMMKRKSRTERTWEEQ